MAVGRAPGEKSAELKVVLDGSSVRVPLYIWYQGEGTIDGCLLYARLYDALGRESTGAFDIVDPDRSDAPLARGTIDASSRRVALRLAALPPSGTFSGAIVAEVNGANKGIATIQVVRSDLKVAFQDEATDGSIQIRPSAGDWSQTLTLVETAPQQSGVPLSLVTASLTGADDRTVPLDVEPKSVKLEPGLIQKIKLSAKGTPIGTWNGTLTLAAEARRKTYRVVVRRDALPPLVSLEAPQSIVAHAWCPWARVDVQIPILATGLAGSERVPLDMSLTKATVMRDGSEVTGAEFEKWRMLLGNASFASSDGTSTSELRVAPGKAAAVTMRVDGLRGGTQINLAMRVGADGATDVTRVVSVRVKDWWVYAAVVMAFGTWASYRLKRWMQKDRRLALGHLRVQRVLARMREALPSPADPIRTEIERLLAEAQSDGALGVKDDIEEKVKEAQGYLAADVTVRDVLALEVVLDALSLPADAHASIAQRFTLLREARRTQNLSGLRPDGQNRVPLVDQATALRQSVLREVGESLTQRLDAMKETIARVRTDLARVTATASKDVEAKVASIEKEIAALTDKLGAGVTLDAMLGYRIEYRRLTSALAAAAGEAFAMDLEAQNTPPLGFDAVAWEDLRKRVLAKLREDGTPSRDVGSRYDDARLVYLAELLSRLARRCREDARAARSVPDLKAKAPEYERIAKDADAVPREDLDAAQRAYQKLRDDYGRVTPPATPPMHGQHPAAPELPSAPASMPAAAPWIPQPAPAVDWTDDEKTVRRIRRGDAGAAAVVGFLAVTSGLQIFWGDAASFGSGYDYLKVLLWGFGLHFANPSDLAAHFAKIGSTPGNTPAGST